MRATAPLAPQAAALQPPEILGFPVLRYVTSVCWTWLMVDDHPWTMHPILVCHHHLTTSLPAAGALTQGETSMLMRTPGPHINQLAPNIRTAWLLSHAQSCWPMFVQASLHSSSGCVPFRSFSMLGVITQIGCVAPHLVKAVLARPRTDGTVTVSSTHAHMWTCAGASARFPYSRGAILLGLCICVRTRRGLPASRRAVATRGPQSCPLMVLNGAPAHMSSA